jgi:hypothetical protein
VNVIVDLVLAATVSTKLVGGSGLVNITAPLPISEGNEFPLPL